MRLLLLIEYLLQQSCSEHCYLELHYYFDHQLLPADSLTIDHQTPLQQLIHSSLALLHY